MPGHKPCRTPTDKLRSISGGGRDPDVVGDAGTWVILLIADIDLEIGMLTEGDSTAVRVVVLRWQVGHISFSMPSERSMSMRGDGLELGRCVSVGLVRTLEALLLGRFDVTRRIEENMAVVDGRGLAPDDGLVLIDGTGLPDEEKEKGPRLPIELGGDGRAAVDWKVMVAPFVPLDDRHDGPGHNSVSKPKDRFISTNGRCDDLKLRSVEGRAVTENTDGRNASTGREDPDAVAARDAANEVGLQELGVDEARTMVEAVGLSMFDERHEGPEQTPNKTPNDKLTPIIGGLGDTWPGTTVGMDKLLIVLLREGVEPWVLLPLIVVGRH